jgi:cell division initiation protein
MSITPLEIRKQEFKKKVRGYDPHEVHEFLEMLATEMEELLRENTGLAERVKDMDSKIEDYRRMEKILQDTLTTTQQASDELKSGAKKEAETIIANARVEAQRFLKDAQTELNKIREETKMAEHQKLLLVSEFRGLLESYLRLLERLEKK